MLGMIHSVLSVLWSLLSVKGRSPSEAAGLQGRQRSGLCRELYGRGLIGTLKATTWYQQLQERQNQSPGRQKRRPKAKNSVRMQVSEQLSPGHTPAFQEICCTNLMLLQPDMLASPPPVHSPAVLLGTETPSLQWFYGLSSPVAAAPCHMAPIGGLEQQVSVGIMESLSLCG